MENQGGVMKKSITVSVVIITIVASIYVFNQQKKPQNIVESHIEKNSENLSKEQADLRGDDQSTTIILSTNNRVTEGRQEDPKSVHIDKRGINRLDFSAEKYRTEILDDIWLISASDIEDLQRNSDAGDSDDAYSLYLYYMDCYGLARSEQVFNETINSVNEGIQFAEMEEDLDSLNYFAKLHDYVIKKYEECDSEKYDYQYLSYEALKKAATYGHVLAQIDFSSLGRALITQNQMLIKYPNLVDDYKFNARNFLQLAAKSGHPEAFLKIAIEYDNGLIFYKNHFKSYAYVHAYKQAAERTSIIIPGGMDELIMENAEKFLSLREQKKSREDGYDIYDEVYKDK